MSPPPKLGGSASMSLFHMQNIIFIVPILVETGILDNFQEYLMSTEYDFIISDIMLFSHFDCVIYRRGRVFIGIWGLIGLNMEFYRFYVHVLVTCRLYQSFLHYECVRFVSRKIRGPIQIMWYCNNE